MKTCHFHVGAQQCPAPGSMQLEGGPWWCHWHSPSNSFDENRAILNDLLEHGVPKVKHYSDFIIDLVIHGISPEAAIAKWHEHIRP